MPDRLAKHAGEPVRFYQRRHRQPFSFPFSNKLKGDCLEGIASADVGSDPLFPLSAGRVTAATDLHPRFVTKQARFLEPDLGIAAEGQLLFLALMAVFHAPKL